MDNSSIIKVDLKYPKYTHFKQYEENHRHFLIQNVTQEKFTALYKFIVNQKTHFVKEAIEFDPFQTPKFAWMDMRLHCVYDMSLEETNQAMADIPPNQVKLMQMSLTDPVHNRHDFYAWTRGKVAAGFFGGDKEAVHRFCELCQKEWLEALQAGTAPTDEMIYAFVISHHPYMFDLYVGEYSECLKNQVHIRAGLHLVVGHFDVPDLPAQVQVPVHRRPARRKRVQCPRLRHRHPHGRRAALPSDPVW